MNNLTIIAMVLTVASAQLIKAEHSEILEPTIEGRPLVDGKPPGVIGQPQFHVIRFPQECRNERNQMVSFDKVDGKITVSILPEATCEKRQKAYTQSLYCESGTSAPKRIVTLVYNRAARGYEARDILSGLTNNLSGEKVDVLNGEWKTCAHKASNTSSAETASNNIVGTDKATFERIMAQKSACLKNEEGQLNEDRDAQTLYEALAFVAADTRCKNIGVIKSKQQYLTRGLNPCVIQLDPKTKGIGGGTLQISLIGGKDSIDLTWDANHLEEMTVEKWLFGSPTGPSNGHVGIYQQLEKLNICQDTIEDKATESTAATEEPLLKVKTAKEALQDKMKKEKWPATVVSLVAIGIKLNPPSVEVRLKETLPAKYKFPKRINGVPVNVVVTGPIHPRTKVAPEPSPQRANKEMLKDHF